MKAFQATVTAEGRVTVPAPVRAALKLKPGDTVVFDQDDAGRFRLRVGGRDSRAARSADPWPDPSSDVPTDLALIPWIARAARQRLEPVSDSDDPIGDDLVAEDERTKTRR